MTHHCQHERCFPDISCALGHIHREKCEHWLAGTDIAPKPEGEPQVSDLPWNSYTLGTSDLAILGGRGRPIVVGLVGAPDSGKTSLLVILYMWLLKNGEVPGWVFSGSWTLGGWETLVQHGRWMGEVPPAFPPHTSSAGRLPGLLHLAMRNGTGVVRDVFFTDAPGEWFTYWSKAPHEEGAGGARWVIDHSDVLLLLADRGALANPETLPRARRETRDLIERVGAVCQRPPIIFAWTKKDLALAQPIWEAVETSRHQFASDSEEFETTTENPETIARVFSRALTLGESNHRSLSLIEPRQSTEPFLAFRGSHGSD